MPKYYKLNNGIEVPCIEVIASEQEAEYYQLYFIGGSSLEQRGKMEIIEREENNDEI